ncbi:MAG: GNAT family N-acetyltransferase [Acidimicrobiales bacterium]
MISLRTVGEDEWELWRSLRRAALADAPDAFGSTLAEWSGSGDTEERWRRRLRTVPCNVVASLDEIPVGMVSGTGPVDEVVELIGMWCAPRARGAGVGDALVAAIVQWARSQGAASLQLDVRVQNPFAIALYERQGFVDEGLSTAVGVEFPERRMRLGLESP